MQISNPILKGCIWMTIVTSSAPAWAGDIKGLIETVTAQSDGRVTITGWACDTQVASSIDVHVYAVKQAGLSGAVLVANGPANKTVDSAVSNSCLTSNTPHRFSVVISAANAAKYVGKKIYVHGISKSNRPNYTITKSGSFTIPAKPAVVTPTPTPTPSPTPTPTPPVVVNEGTFDAYCYLARYPDVKASATYGKNPQLHWNNLGKKEGRIPGCLIGKDSATSMSIDMISSQFAGSVTSLKWNGREFINIWDHGRQLQSAMQVDGYAECNNPTEAGSEADAKKLTSTSTLNSAQFTANSMVVETQMAYWSANRVTGACVKGADPRVTKPQSNHLLQKVVTIGHQGDQQIAKFTVTFKSPRNEVSSAFVYEFLTGYLNSEFTQFYTLSGTALNKVTALNDISGSGFPKGSYHTGSKLPSVLASEDGQFAMGAYFPVSQLSKCSTSFHGYNMYRFNLGGSGAKGNATNKWSLAVNESLSSACVIADGAYYKRTFEVYVVVGTLEQVRVKLGALASQLP